jgi:hypothetical protein
MHIREIKIIFYHFGYVFLFLKIGRRRMHIVVLSLEADVLFYSSVTRSVVLFQVRITATLLQ